MRSRYLPVILSNADLDVTQLAPILQRNAPVEWAFSRLCRNYRIRGCAEFFLSGQARALHQDLQRSGTAHAFFLGEGPDAEKVTSRAAPLFDAVACGDKATAERIARNAPGAHRPDREHLEDFLYVHFLLQHFFLGAAPDTCEDIATRLTEASAEDVAATARADVCRALLTRNADGFQEALLTLIGEHRSWYETGFQRGRLPEEAWAIEGNLFIEGLALVRLARSVGMATAEEYPLIPSLAFATPSLAFDAQAWRVP